MAENETIPWGNKRVYEESRHDEWAAETENKLFLISLEAWGEALYPWDVMKKKNKQSKKEFLEIKNMKWNKNSVAVLEEIVKESSPKANKE